ncbi:MULTISPECIES: aldo/keto reductase [unclassified Pseudofrankia]|uniref:aldo/keto reductase n=1 Tax=unclassified Pseudofrankia TaxID=2994372 RepID=UPI0008DAF02C|nr:MULTISPECIES: aldo/keto reductase [unclassified Pseudofrankia]MDT3441005.1 aldo/keto reductase [Pseudofrankia sp. BMG5.37]OHV45474.1 aldo/keto reductase [Pseudofrankia sp. BMG5.36]
MRYRTLGASGLRVSELILGAMTFGEQGGVGAPLEECRRILDAFAEAGGNTLDTAINYRDGASEEILGELLTGRRESFVLGTKYTVSRDRADPNAAGNARKNLRASLETSLRRLRTDHIDVYWVHMWDRFTPIEETMRALDDAIRAGKILYIGISDAPAWVVARANTLADWRGWSQFVGLQVPYSLLNRDIERELLPMAQSLGLGVTAWSPLGGGVLSGKYIPPAGPSTAGTSKDQAGGPAPTRLSAASLTELDLAVARTVREVADELGVTPSQVAIAWTTCRSAAILPILGARRVDQLRDNLGALDVTLTPDLVARLDSATGFSPGFPTEFIDQTSPWVLGAADLDSQPHGAR